MIFNFGKDRSPEATDTGKLKLVPIKGGPRLTNILAISLVIISDHKPGSDGIISTLALLKPSSKVSLAAGISVADITELLTQAGLSEVDCSSAVDEDGVIASSGSASVEAVLLLTSGPATSRHLLQYLMLP
ncbi:unnamed protein product [Parnassius apollo]|uniref:(apollo) hypothetical protein n=1 Tax=Parnassius apollo TaxID=110799 RepID=A0A8S3W620_PARAO|nr:unnamed protein product [Parnassius apollo]